MMRMIGSTRSVENDATDPIPFPSPRRVSGRDRVSEKEPDVGSAERAMAAVETVSRRIDDLARELNCLGYFDGDDDRPRAA